MIRRTLIILNNLATNTLSTLLIGTREIVTIKKSKIFQPSEKNLLSDRSEIIRIMISITKNTSLAVVAPGIAEALFATALGLVAAIPAVIAYNKISKDLNRYAARLDDFSSEFSAIILRQMEGRK